MQQMRLVGGGEPRDTAEGAQSQSSAPQRRAKRIGWYAAAASAAVIAVLAAWWLSRGPPAPKFLTVPVTRGTVARTVTATGTVNPVMTIIVGSYVSGVIRDVYCDYNTRVKKGQICAKIDPRPYEAALAQARGQLARDTAQLNGARIDLARYHTLVGQDSIAVQTYDDQRALVHQLEGQVQIDRAAVQTAQVNLGYTNIISPVNGTVVARNITIGQTVAASFQTPTLFLIATDLTRMQIDTNVSESDIGAVKKGNLADFTVEAYPGRTFQGRIVQVRQAPQVVQNVVTYDAVVGVQNPDFVLKPGMTATVSIVTEQRADVLRVPDRALRFAPGGFGSPATKQTAQKGGSSPRAMSEPIKSQRVWMLREGKPVAVPVHTGLDDGAYSEVIGGELRVGDRLIIGEQRAAAGSRARTFRFRL